MKFYVSICLLLGLGISSVYSMSPIHREREQNQISGLKFSAKELSEQNLTCHFQSDCSTLPLGQKGCGGPTSHLIVSQMNPYLNAISFLAELSTKKERKFNERYNVISDCMYAMPPKVTCQQNLCVPAN